MQGQPAFKQGLPSSRSDTMLLAAAQPAPEAAAAATNGGSSRQQQQQAGGGEDGMLRRQRLGEAAASGSIPVFVMLPLDTVGGVPRRRG